jgi:hypothetical protein
MKRSRLERSCIVSDTVNAGEPVRAKAALIDPTSLDVVWMNEAAAEGFTVSTAEASGAVPIERVIPMAESMGVPEALRRVRDSGKPEHMRTSIVASARGSIGLAASVYRLPDGMLLVVAENDWQNRERDAAETLRRGRRR